MKPNKPRASEQRTVIREELCKVRTHPTANDIYQLVRKRMPRISLGTVYRNLEMLSQAGIIKKLETAGTERRYDGVTENHYHIRCIECGRLEDIASAPLESINDAVREVSDYQILWHNIMFVGICPRCKDAA